VQRGRVRRLEEKYHNGDNEANGGIASEVTSPRESGASSSSFSIRRSKEWDSILEQRGESRFNPLQMDAQMVIEDSDGVVVECIDHPLKSTKGVKCVPVIQSGRYQYEIELLRDHDSPWSFRLPRLCLLILRMQVPWSRREQVWEAIWKGW